MNFNYNLIKKWLTPDSGSQKVLLQQWLMNYTTQTLKVSRLSITQTSLIASLIDNNRKRPSWHSPTTFRQRWKTWSKPTTHPWLKTATTQSISLIASLTLNKSTCASKSNTMLFLASMTLWYKSTETQTKSGSTTAELMLARNYSCSCLAITSILMISRQQTRLWNLFSLKRIHNTCESNSYDPTEIKNYHYLLW